MIKIGYYQFAPQLGKKKENLETVRNKILSDSQEMDILVLPELFNTGYYFTSKKEVDQLSEPADGETYKTLKEIAQKKNCHIFGGFAEKADGFVYNASMLVSPEGKRWIYRKTHLFLEEKLFFARSNSEIEPITLNIKGKEIKAGLMICFDWFFPETARTLALKGAQILLHTANLVMPYCPAATITRALENRVFIVLCDRIGTDKRIDQKKLSFIGLSRVVSPKGEILASSNETNEEIKIVEIDPEEAKNKRLNPLNDIFEDRRSDLYSL